ncbi:conserved hypothetical protein [delta proteobacterium NaphS2]|nr:conserved hypothetical protein [delta proteobacterium NaphS2]
MVGFFMSAGRVGAVRFIVGNAVARYAKDVCTGRPRENIAIQTMEKRPVDCMNKIEEK